MKVEELQINDLVQYTDEDGTYNVQVKGVTTAIYFRHPLSGEFILFADPDRFKPIPLSVEILKENGFQDVPNGYRSIDGQVFIGTYEGKWNVLIYEQTNPSAANGRINYVHELQHMLNLWKPEMTIKL